MRAVVTEFRNAPLEQRSTLRDRLTMDDCYTLISYARRTAVLAARESDTAAAGDAAVSLAMIDADRVDWRDVLVALGLVGHVLVGLGDTGALGAARDMATGDIVSMIARFAPPSREDAEAATWGLRQVRTAYGIGYADAGVELYAPVTDLVDVALGVASLLEDDAYRTVSVRVGEQLPVVWLPGTSPRRADRVVDRCRGCIVISTILSADAFDGAEAQQLTVFVVEARNAGDARSLESWSVGGSHAALTVRREAVVCVLVARSFVEGVAPFESDASLRRFEDGLGIVLGL